MAEIEAKYLIEDDAQAEQLLACLRAEGLEVRPLPAVEIVDRYWDTPDWKFLRAGWAYRWREADGQRTLCLKAIGVREGAVHKREEVEQEVASFPPNGNGLAKGKVARKLKKLASARPRELLQIRNCRRIFMVSNSTGTAMELALDHATISAPVPPDGSAPRRLCFEEAELELKEGSEESLRGIASALQDRLGLLPSRMSKFERGLQTVGLTIPPEVRPETQGLEELCGLQRKRRRRAKKRDPEAEYAGRYLLDHFERMLVEEPKAWEGLDPEGVHRMRVATRRLRSGLRAFATVLPTAAARSFNQELKWLAGVLGKVRDLDVLIGNCDRYDGEIPASESGCLAEYRQYLAGRRREARRELLAALSGDRFRQLRTEFVSLLHGLASYSASLERTPRIWKSAVHSIGPSCRKVLRDGRSITADSPDEAVHALRIDCKRLRYLIEIYVPLDGKRLRPFLKSVKQLQDGLGEFQDASVAVDQLLEYAQQVPLREADRNLLLVLGQLIQLERDRAARQRAGFGKAWKRFDRRGRRKEVLARLRPG